MDTVSIATLGGHSALEVCLGAKIRKFKTVLILAKGREKTYTHYYKNLVDHPIMVGTFRDLTNAEVASQLQKQHAVFIPHRYCQVYCDMDKLEKEFPVPVFGNKFLLKYEERESIYTQYKILDAAGVTYPKQFETSSQIDRLVIVKVKEAARPYERAFFFAKNKHEFDEKAESMAADGKIHAEDLIHAVIEEYLIGAQINFNFFYSPMRESLELLGTDIRRQTNIDGIIRMPYNQQVGILEEFSPSYIEAGHIAVTVKESVLQQAFELAEKVLQGAKKVHPKGIIGPFALQTAVIPGPPKETIIVYDLSLRMPGSPGTAATPYSQYHFGRSVSFGERIAMEIEEAQAAGKLGDVTT